MQTTIAMSQNVCFSSKEKAAMKRSWKNSVVLLSSVHRPRLASFVGISSLLAFVIVLSGCSGNAIPPVSAASNNTQAPSSSAATSYPIQVYFSKYPDSLQTNSLSAAFPVNRSSPTLAVATFSIQLLIAGPTLSEQQAGYFSELNTMLGGPSNCTGSVPIGGPDFIISMNMKGTSPQAGTATVKFCRGLSSPGIGADARVKAEITATLKQFANIKSVVILTKDGNCFGDESGRNVCLR
jgi:hypothetical protein